MALGDQEVAASAIADRVRATRSERRWTLNDLAARSEVSRRLLVQIEQAEANPSLATLLKLAAALEISLQDLLGDQPSRGPLAVTSGDKAKRLWSTPEGSYADLLVAHADLELWSWELAAGQRHRSDAHRPGSIELLHVTGGTVRLSVDGRDVDIPAGDSARFDATYAHAYENPATDAARFTLVVLEPA